MKVSSKALILMQLGVSLLSLLCTAAGKIQVGLSPSKNLSFRLDRTSFLSTKAKKNLSSGLSTKALVLARLIELPDHQIDQLFITIDSKYDLWDEKFYVTLSDSPRLTLLKQDDLEKLYEAPGPFQSMSGSSLKKGTSYKIEVVETLNPLDKEKFESLQKWVTEQRSTLRSASANADASVSNVIPETSFSTLFYSLWKRASEGDVLTGEISRHEESDPFRVESLK